MFWGLGPWAGAYAVQAHEGDFPRCGGPHPFWDQGQRVLLPFIKMIQVVGTAGAKVRKSGRHRQPRGDQFGQKGRRE